MHVEGIVVVNLNSMGRIVVATKAKKENKSKLKPDFSEESSELRDAAMRFLGEVEKSGETLATEVKIFFEQVTDQVIDVASTAAKKTASVTEKVAGTDPGEHLSRVMNEVKEAGELSMRVIGEGVDALREHILDLASSAADKPKKGGVREPAANKKARTKKTDKKQAASRKAAAKKTRKKQAVKKQRGAKKTTKKRVVKKVIKKPTAKKKVATKKVAKKKASRRKVAES